MSGRITSTFMTERRGRSVARRSQELPRFPPPAAFMCFGIRGIFGCRPPPLKTGPGAPRSALAAIAGARTTPAQARISGSRTRLPLPSSASFGKSTADRCPPHIPCAERVSSASLTPCTRAQACATTQRGLTPRSRRGPATAATAWPLQAMFAIVLPRPVGVCLLGPLSSNVRRRKH